MAVNLNISTTPSIQVNDYHPSKSNLPGGGAQLQQNPASVSHSSSPAAVVTKSLSSPDKGTNTTTDKTPSKNRNVSSTNQANLQSVKRFVFEHDNQSGLSVVKFMDSKGNVIFQVPPEQYLKSVQLLRTFGELNIQNESGATQNLSDTGMLLNKKV
jgi:uncharacterized FlaG/YvyC family protein